MYERKKKKEIPWQTYEERQKERPKGIHAELFVDGKKEGGK